MAINGAWDSDLSNNYTFSNGDRDGTSTSVTDIAVGTDYNDSGKKYFEVEIVNLVDGLAVGITGGPDLGSGFIVLFDDGVVNDSLSVAGNIGTFVEGDVVCIAVDFDNGFIWFRVNGGVWNDGLTGESPEDETSSFSPTGNYPALGSVTNAGNVGRLNTGTEAFAFTKPVGYDNWYGTFSSGQDIGGARVNNTTSFYGAVVGRGAVNINGALVTDADTFYVSTVGRGAVNIGGALFTNSTTFFAANVKFDQNITGALFTNAQTYGAATVGGTYNITGARFDDGDTFYGSVVGAGAVGITGALYDNTQTFFTAGVIPLTPIVGARFDNSNAFYGATISATAAIVGALFTNSQTFYGATVASLNAIVGSRLDNSTSFFASNVVLEGADQNIGGVRYDDPDTFFTAVVEREGGANDNQPNDFVIRARRRGRR